MKLMLGSFALSMPTVWIIAVIVFAVVEGMTAGLVTIWFALGALAALLASLFGAPLWLQLVWFFVISVATLIATRPLARKYLNGRTEATNADMYVGKECVVTETIDNIRGTGAVKVAGKVWTARTEEDTIVPVGTKAEALRIEGVKLIVKPVSDQQFGEA